MPTPSYYDLGGQMLPGGRLQVSPSQGGIARNMPGIDIPLPGSSGTLPPEYQNSIPGAGLPLRGEIGGAGGGDRVPLYEGWASIAGNIPPNDDYNFEPTDTYYNELPPSVQAAIAQHASRQQEQEQGEARRPLPASIVAAIAQQRRGEFGRTAADTQAYFDPHAANMRAFAQADWNRGMWSANPQSGEMPEGSGRHSNTIGRLAARLGMMGRLGGGKGGLVMPGSYQ